MQIKEQDIGYFMHITGVREGGEGGGEGGAREAEAPQSLRFILPNKSALHCILGENIQKLAYTHLTTSQPPCSYKLVYIPRTGEISQSKVYRCWGWTMPSQHVPFAI